MGNYKRSVWTKDDKMTLSVIFLLTIYFLNNVFARNQAIGFYIKNDNLGGRVVGLCFGYLFFVLILLYSYKIVGESMLINTVLYMSGIFINYYLYTIFYKFYINKYKREYNKNKFLFLIKHKGNFLENTNENFRLFQLDEKDLEIAKKLKLIKGGIIGDSLLLPYEFLNKEQGHKRYLKYGLRQSLIEDNGMTSDDSDHLMMTYQSLVKSLNKEDFQKILARKLKFWIFTLPIGIGLTTIKAIIKLLIGFSPMKSGINSLGNGPLMRVSIIAAYFSNDEFKRNEYIKASSETTHNNDETVKMTQIIGNVIAFVYENNKKPTKEELLKLLTCSNSPLTEKYIKVLLNNLNSDLKTFLNAIDSNKMVTGYIMTSSVFILYVLYNAKDYKEAFEMIIEAAGDTDTIGAVIGSMFALLDENMLANMRLHYILLNSNDDIIKYSYWNNLIKNVVSIPIILVHGVIRIVSKLL